MEAIGHNLPALKQGNGRAQKAFNLIEAAIVLAVVGGVIGGIWTVSAAVYENYKVEKTVEGIFTTARNIQNLISMNDTNGFVINQDINNTIIGADLIPKDWINGASLYTPMGNGLVVYAKVSPPDTFVIKTQNMTKSGCIKLMVKTTSREANKSGNARDLVWVNTKNPDQYPGAAFPITPDQAASYCVDGITVQFYFRYTRINN